MTLSASDNLKDNGSNHNVVLFALIGSVGLVSLIGLSVSLFRDTLSRLFAFSGRSRKMGSKKNLSSDLLGNTNYVGGQMQAEDAVIV